MDSRVEVMDGRRREARPARAASVVKRTRPRRTSSVRGAKPASRPKQGMVAPAMSPPDVSPAPPTPLAVVRVWDLPTRLFHWVLAASVVGSVVTANIGGNAMPWHFRLGYLAFTLLAFRLLWGFVGGHWSRFASFVPTPGRLLRYVGGRLGPGERVDIGHNPLGSLSVLAMLALLVAQVSTGLVADDEIAHTGPLNRFVANATAQAATAWHKQWGSKLIVALVVLHVAAIVYYRVGRRLDLVRPMIHGDKLLPAGVPASADGARQRLLALALVIACAAAAAWVASFGG